MNVTKLVKLPPLRKIPISCIFIIAKIRMVFIKGALGHVNRLKAGKNARILTRFLTAFLTEIRLTARTMWVTHCVGDPLRG